MKRVALVAAVGSVALLSVACEEDPPEAAVTPTPSQTFTPAETPIPVTLPGDGSIAAFDGRIAEPGESDPFTVDLAAGDSLRIDVDAEALSPSAGDIDAIVTLFGPDGGIVAHADDGTNFWDAGTDAPGPLLDAYLVATAAVAGRYTAVVEDAVGDGADTADFAYRVAFSLVQSSSLAGGLACVDASPLPALTGTAQVVSITGTLAPTSTDSCCGDTVIDCVGSRVEQPDLTYTMTLSSGETVQITRSGAAFDGAIYVTTDCSASNNTIINACVAGADGADDTDGVVFTPTATALHYIFVDAVAGSSGSFTLDVRRLP